MPDKNSCFFKHKLGAEVKEVISGFVGVVTGRCEYLTGCRQYSVHPNKLGKDGKLLDSYWFDEDKLIPTGKKEIVLGNNQAKEASKNNGCDVNPPKQKS